MCIEWIYSIPMLKSGYRDPPWVKVDPNQSYHMGKISFVKSHTDSGPASV